jgi:2-dehydropantoate 2-reductase
MRIAIVGCGALGSFYGGKLARFNSEVHFLLRTDYQEVNAKGLFVESVDGSFHVHPRCAARPELIGLVDLVLIGLKTTANDQFRVLLPSLVGPSTMIVTLQNGLGNEEALAAIFGPQNILGGLCFVCVNRETPGRIHHTAYGKIVLGEFRRSAQPRTRELSARFREAGIPCDVTEDLARAHWEKLVWNIPFNGLGVAGITGYEALITGDASGRFTARETLTTDRLLADARWEQLVRELMTEVVKTARALGHGLDDRLIELNVNRTRTMGPYKASTLLDFERGRPLELDSLFFQPLNAARQAGVSTPRLSALCAVLSQCDRMQLSPPGHSNKMTQA